MPTSTQALYFHLGMNADDDGFVNPKKIMRMMGAVDDDLKVLIGKRFVLPFENGVVVIKHWLVHNSIRKDRYHATQYREEKARLVVKEGGVYTDVIPLLATTRQPDGNQLAPEVKLRQAKTSKAKRKKPLATQAPPADPNIPLIIDLFKTVNPSYSRLFGMPPQRAATERLLKQYGFEKLAAMIAYLPKSNASQFAPTITTPVQFEHDLGKLIAWSQKEKEKFKGNGRGVA